MVCIYIHDSIDLRAYPKLLQNSTNIFLLNFPSLKTSFLMTDIASNGLFDQSQIPNIRALALILQKW